MAHSARATSRTKRIAVAAAALAIACASVGGAALAQPGRGKGNNGNGNGNGDGRWDRAPAAREWNPGQGQGRRMQPPEARGYAPQSPYAAPRYGLRRGAVLPPQMRGAPVEDYERYRLRQPPRGYSWRRAGDGFMLVGPNGVVFDIID